MFKRVLFIASLLFCISYSSNAATLAAHIKYFQTNPECTYQVFNFKDSSTYTGTHKSANRDKWYYGDGTTDTGVAPAPKMYTTTGTFIVSLVVTNATDGLKDSTTKTVTITGTGVLPSYSEVGPLCERSEPKFTITSSGTASYFTDFGDGSSGVSGDLIGQVHTYQLRGTYNIIIKDSTSAGCKSTAKFPVVVAARPFARNPTIVKTRCQDSSQTFVAFQLLNSDTSGMHVTYSWRFPDKTTYNGKTVTKFFPDSGNFNAWIILTNHTGNCNDSFSFNFIVASNPKVNFYMVPHCQDSLAVIYDSTQIQYTATSYPTSWKWMFCDSNHSNCDTAAGYSGFAAPAAFNYGFPHGGTFYVTEYVISTDGCRDSLQKKVYVNPTPTPNFVFRNTCQDSAVQFTDASTVPKGNSIVAWDWNFGDTTITKQQSKLQDPAHKYLKPGYHYSVRLIPKTQAGCIDSIRENVVVYPLPATDFVFISECQNVQVPFANTSTMPDTSKGDILSHYVWIYGDGTANDTTINALHAFKDSGYHNVKLVAFSSYGCSDTITHSVYIYPLPKPSFVLGSNCERDSVKFINTSTSTFGTLTDSSYTWDFGDSGIAQFVTNPNHFYRYPDTFNVNLTATTRIYGCKKDTAIPVIIIPGPHSADSIGAKCTGAPITFYNKTTSKHPGVIKYIWEFGDGTSDTSSSQNPNNVVHTYPSTNNYKATLTSFMPATGCTDSIRIPVFVTPRPIVSFKANNACNDSIVTCVDSSYVPGYPRPVNLQSWAWDFGDGHFASGVSSNGTVTHKYASPGVYTIREYVTSTSTCEDSFTRQVTIYEVPVSKFSYVESCAGTPTPFTSLTTAADSVAAYRWVFSADTTTADSTQNATHIFHDNDILNASLTVTTANGCPNTKTSGIAIFTSPVSQFSYNLACNNRPFNFVATNLNIVQQPNYIASFHWDFGDTAAADQPDTSDVQNPSKIYFTHAGTYSVALTEVSNQGCVSIDTEQVIVPELPVSGFQYNGNCVGRQFVFVDTTKLKGVIANWDLGGGTNSGFAFGNPQYNTYLTAGTYLVKLYDTKTYTIGTNPQITCVSDTAYATIVVNPSPFVKFSADTSCFGQPTPFYDSSKANGGVITRYSWSFGDNTIDSTNKSQFFHIYADSFAGSNYIYTAVLKITTNFGCDSSDTQKVFVRQIPYASFTASPNPAQISTPQITFTNTTQNADPAHYYWTFGDSTDSHEINPTHTYKDTGTFLVTLATDNDYCMDTFRYIVYVTPGYTLYAPNCITVNGDGKNDAWMAKGVGVIDFDVVIVDRWGQQVFHSTDMSKPWNADYNGNGVKVPDGVYVYSIKAGDFSSTNFTSLKGNITVLH